MVRGKSKIEQNRFTMHLGEITQGENFPLNSTLRIDKIHDFVNLNKCTKLVQPKPNSSLKITSEFSDTADKDYSKINPYK